MKALKFLKHMKQTDTPYNFREWEINKAIEELEEAQLTRREWYQKGYAEAMKPKTCERCKHYEEKQCTNENSIAFGGINAVYEDDFCNDFEPKDEK